MEEIRLYIDVEITAKTHSRGYEYKTFGPFSSRQEAERALTAFIARDDAREGHIRDPDA